MLKNILLVGLGGGIGSMLRFVCSVLINTKLFPWSTLLVNITGCFAIGVIYAFSIRGEAGLHNWKLFLSTGLCGGFTTFSAFSLENMGMLQSGKAGLAMMYMGLSVVLGIAATFAGYLLVVRS